MDVKLTVQSQGQTSVHDNRREFEALRKALLHSKKLTAGDAVI